MTAQAPGGVTMSMTERAASSKSGDSAPTAGSPAPARRRTTSSRDRRVQIAAAKARVTLDKRLHVETPKWIIDLANEKAS